MHHRPPAAVLLRILRHRPPLYLHLKLYLVTALVSLFLARPVSKSGKRIKDDLQRKLYAPHSSERVNHQFTPRLSCHAGNIVVNEDRQSTSGPWRDAAGIPRRWRERLKDLASVSKSLAEEERSIQGHPSTTTTKTTAKVRLASDPSPEISFLEARRRVMLPSFQALVDDLNGTGRSRLSLQPHDLPLIALGGSGGGFRAMLSFAGFLHGCSEVSVSSPGDPPLLDLVTYLSGVSGSCWTLSSLYTHCNLSTSNLVQHYLAVCQEECHPMSMRAFDTVARSPRGNYWLFAPLVKKARQGGRGGGLMELYATLTSSYLLLPRVGVREKVNMNMNMSGIGWSRVFEKNNLQEGRAPLPILTAARIVVEEKEAAVPSSDGRIQEQDQASTAPLATYRPKVEWWEFSPLEVGSADITRSFTDTSSPSWAEGRGAYIPTTSFGPPWNAGHPTSSPSELPLSLILGHCTSAPAGPLTGYISALLSTLPAPRKTMMRWALEHLNRFLMMRRWRKRWGNPIRSSKEWNPFFGMLRCVGSSPTHTQDDDGDGDVRVLKEDQKFIAGHGQRTAIVDSDRKIKLIDAGVSNNLPAHIFYQSPPSSSSSSFSSSSSLSTSTTTTTTTTAATTKNSSPQSQSQSQARSRADIFIGFDASSDVHSPLSLQRIQDFGRERNLKFWFAEESEDLVERWRRRRRDESVEKSEGVGEGKDGGGGGGGEKRRRLSLDEYLDWYRSTSNVANPIRRDKVGRRVESTEDEDQDLDQDLDLSHRYCIVLSGYHSTSSQPATSSSSSSPDHDDDHEEDLADFTYIYIPLLAHQPQPQPPQTQPQSNPNVPLPDPQTNFNPNNGAPFATVYNLLWTQAQARYILHLARTLARSEFVREKILKVVRRWIGLRKRKRERKERRKREGEGEGEGDEDMRI